MLVGRDLYSRVWLPALSFGRYSDANFLTKSTLIETSLTNNPFFPDPVPTLVEIAETLANYADKLTAAGGGGAQNVADKNAARLVLEGLLGQLGLYIMFTAKGSIPALASSGYTLVKEPQPRNLTSPGNVELTFGITLGQLISKVPKGNGSGFIHEITDALPGETTVWTSFPEAPASSLFKILYRGASIGCG